MNCMEANDFMSEVIVIKRRLMQMMIFMLCMMRIL